MEATIQGQSQTRGVGLTAAEVEDSRRRHGRNVLTSPPRDPEWKKFLEKFDDPTIKILLVAAAISLVMGVISKFVLHGHGGFVDGLGVLVAVLLATTVAYFNERKSSREFELLNQAKEAIDVKVTRDGEIRMVPIADLVAGDLVHLSLGDKVPADGEIVSNLGLAVDESMLTGESMPVEKNLDGSTQEGEADTAFARDRVYRGTMVVDGHGSFVIAAVGDATEMGRIAQGLGEEEEDTPLKRRLTVLANQIGLAGTMAASAIFAVMAVGALWGSEISRGLLGSPVLAGAFVLGGLAVGIPLGRWMLTKMFDDIREQKVYPFAWVLMSAAASVAAAGTATSAWGFAHDPALGHALLNALLLAFVIAVTVVVVAVPEGLPMMVNVSLALNMRKMAKENCLVRRLVASETIGSATVICTDKTGTLTQNRMQPVWYYLGMKTYAATGDGAAKVPEWEHLVRNIAINSNANLVCTLNGVGAAGNATECALLMLLHNQGLDYRGFRDVHRSLHQMDYNSARKMSVAMVDEDGTRVCHLKGAPDQVLANCTHVSVDGRVEPLDGRRVEVAAALARATGEDALRVIGFSERRPSEGTCQAWTEEGCLTCGERVFLGFVGIADPVRPEAPEAVAVCKEAGVRVKMITGDDPRTAAAVARQCGILGEGATAMLSAEFQSIADEDLPRVIGSIQVLARSSPADKLRLVRALRGQGEIVAVTGDGTNDAPALKAADVGLSMGQCGTEVAKEASDIVLLDDNFRSIVTGVRWGRALYQNIQRFLQFQLSVNVVALVVALVGPLVGIPLPLTVPQLLWINIIMDTFAALALSTDPARPRAMKRPPIPRGAHIVTPPMVVTIGINSLYQVAVLLFVLLTNPFGGQSQLEQLTIFFTVFVMFQFWHKFNCRSLHHDESPFQQLLQNPNFLVIVGTITAVQIVMVQTGGPIGELFRTTPLPLTTWIYILALTSTILPVAWLARNAAYWFGLDRVSTA